MEDGRWLTQRGFRVNDHAPSFEGMDRLEGLPADVAAALRTVPVQDKAQLELAVGWAQLEPAAARVAERLRVRVLTWDPLGWDAEREPGLVVAVDGSGSAYSITLFVGAWVLDDPLAGSVARELGALARSVVRVGAVNEAHLISGSYAEMEADGLVAPLLGALDLDPDAPAPAITLVTPWAPIDEETVLRIVGVVYGAVDLDLSPRSLSVPATPVPDCRACRGDRFSAPFELDLARPAMCPSHRAEALAVMARVTHTADRDNPEGWEAFCHAAADLLPAPHVPYPIRNRFLDATVGRNDDLLPEQADAVLAFLDWAGTPELFRAALADLGWNGEAGDGGTFEAVAHDIAYRLGAAGTFDLAARVVDALLPVLPHAAANLHGELASQLAEAGRVDEARRRMALALADSSADLLTEIFAGEVSEAAGDTAEAEERYRASLATARRTGEVDLEHDLLWHLVELLQDDDDRADEVERLRAQRDEVHARGYDEAYEPVTVRSSDLPFGRKVGRNEPCPCGSGRKFKQCHGKE